MKFSAFVPTTLSLLATLAHGMQLSYDETYDVGTTSLNTVSCSDGPHGLKTRGFTTFKSLPGFPHIGGADIIEGWNSVNCGSCLQVTYTNPTSGTKKTINIIAIDRATKGLNIARSAMDELIGGHAKEVGKVNVDVKQVNAALCGLH